MSDVKHQLPTLQELNMDVAEAFKNDEFKLLLNQTPPEKWLKKHPMVNAKYLPIDKTEHLLDKIFQEWRIEVLREGVMFQSIYVTVRVHYLNPINGKWSYHDGVGAKSVQTDSGKSAADLGAIKDAAVMMALPSAKSFAIKDACDHLGKLFGRDVNRKDTLEFAGSYKKPNYPEDKSAERILTLINEATTKQGLQKLLKDCTTPESASAYDTKMKTFN